MKFKNALRMENIFVYISVTRKHFLTHDTSNESCDPRLSDDTNDIKV